MAVRFEPIDTTTPPELAGSVRFEPAPFAKSKGVRFEPEAFTEPEGRGMEIMGMGDVFTSDAAMPGIKDFKRAVAETPSLLRTGVENIVSGGAYAVKHVGQAATKAMFDMSDEEVRSVFSSGGERQGDFNDKVLDYIFDAPDAIGDWVSAVTKEREEGREKVPFKQGPLTYINRKVAPNMPNTIAAVGAGLLAGPAAGLGLLGVSEGGSAAERQEEAGGSVFKSTGIGALSGLAEVGGEMLVLPGFIKGAKEGLPVRQVFNLILENAGQEGATGFAQAFLEVFGVATTEGASMQEAASMGVQAGLAAIPENAWVGGLSATAASAVISPIGDTVAARREAKAQANLEAAYNEAKKPFESTDVPEAEIPPISTIFQGEQDALQEETLFPEETPKEFAGSQVDAPIFQEPAGGEVEETIGFHAGDLGKAEDAQAMSAGRSTGHFGTGTYFVSSKDKITGREDRPTQAVDLTEYNLYKPANEKDAFNLHEALKETNNLALRKDLDKLVETHRKNPDDLLGEIRQTAFHLWLEAGRHAGLTLEQTGDMLIESAQETKALKDKTGADSASTTFMKKLGYEGIDVRGLEELDNTQYGTVVYDLTQPPTEKGGETKAAQAPSTPEGVTVTPRPGPETPMRVKRLEATLNKKFEGVAGFEHMPLKEQAALVEEMYRTDPARLRRIVDGLEDPPGKMRLGAAFSGLEFFAQEAGDYDTLREMATLSKTPRIFSAMGQEIASLDTFHQENSAVGATRNVSEAKEKGYEKRTGKNAKEAKQEVARDIKKATRKQTSTEKLQQFIQELQC